MTHRILAVIGTAPLSLEKARKHLNILPDENSPPSHPDDDVIQDAINDAVAWAENYLLRSITPKRYEAFFDSLPTKACFPRLPFAAPLMALESIHYLDQSGVEQVLDSSTYVVLSRMSPAAFDLKIGQTWPASSVGPESVRVVYTAGYADTATFPSDIMRALKQIMAEFFENREDSTMMNQRPVSFSSKNLLQPHRLYHRNAT